MAALDTRGRGREKVKGEGDRLASLLRTAWREPVEARLLDGSLARLGLAEKEVRRLWREHVESDVDHAQRLWALLALAVWRGRVR